MPIQRCTLKSGNRGYKWGASGKCFSSRAKAEQQGRAIEASKRNRKK